MYALNVLQRLIKMDRTGELLDEITLLEFQGCQHEERVTLLNETACWINEGLKLYRVLQLEEDSPIVLGILSASVLDHIRNHAFNAIEEFSSVWQLLMVTKLTCQTCMKRRKEQVPDSVLELVNQGLVLGHPRRKVQEEKDVNEEDGDRGDGSRELADLSQGEDESTVDPRRELLELAQHLRGDVVMARKEGVRQSRPVQPYRFQEERPDVVVKAYDETFDEYKTGPTVEDELETYKELCGWFQRNPSTASWTTVTGRFMDHGYRNAAGGFHQFYLNDPLVEDQLQHFFPLPPTEVLAKWKDTMGMTNVEPDQVYLGGWLGSLPGGEVKGKDLADWTLEQMVGREGGREDTWKGMKSYIAGKTDSGHFIRLNLHRSRKVVEKMDFAADVDSILWVTDRLRSKSMINLQLMPYRGPKAPIRTHNHAYVELYWPRTELDKGQGRPSTASQEVPISNLPNTHFAHYGKTEGAAEVFVVFPRMRHKYPLRKVWETKVPFEVETFWLDKVVYVALHEFKQPGVVPYTNWELDDIEFKNSGLKEKSLPISSSQLEKLQINIQDILDKNKDDSLYSRFRSYFFVLQVLGIKVSTSTDDDWAKLWDKVVSEQPFLDWEYMEDVRNGELMVDLGFGIHPPENSGLVGFWDTEAIQQGFNYGGYNRGVTHTVSTTSAIGGIHAEMPSIRRKRTHIAYRLTYNLAYEVLRGQRTRLKESFFPPGSAYQVDRRYLDSIKGVVEAFDRNMHKSFGVRDEYRCRASSVKRLLPLLKDKVRDWAVHHYQGS
jgi:hypothetical protein